MGRGEVEHGEIKHALARVSGLVAVMELGLKPMSSVFNSIASILKLGQYKED